MSISFLEPQKFELRSKQEAMYQQFCSWVHPSLSEPRVSATTNWMVLTGGTWLVVTGELLGTFLSGLMLFLQLCGLLCVTQDKAEKADAGPS